MKNGMASSRFGGIRALAFRIAPLLLAVVGHAPGVRANTFVQLEYNISSDIRLRDTIFIELFDDRPLTTANFLQYVNGGHYNNSLMHRLRVDVSHNGIVLQGGGFHPVFQNEGPPLNSSFDPTARVDLDNNPATPLPTVNSEIGLQPFRSNLRGTVAMARADGQPNSANSHYFFNIRDNVDLDTFDGGYAVFGRVVGDGITLMDLYDGLGIINMNQDANNDGVRDAGPFFRNITDGLPAFINATSFLPLTLERAKQINYYGSGPGTTVPGGDLTSSGRDAFIDAGAVINGTDGLSIASGRTLGVREGTFLRRTLANRGTLAPGLQIGPLAVDTFQQFPTGTLEIQIAGTTVGTQYDQVNVAGLAFLGGALDVSLVAGYAPKHGDLFHVVTAAGGLVGNFAAGDLPLLSGGLVWSVNRTENSLSLSVARADFNRNGVVDAADFIIWRKTLNQTGTGLAADGNGDGKVDDTDYQIWRANFGNIAGTPPASGNIAPSTVPEPATAGVLIVAGTLLFLWNRGRPACCNEAFSCKTGWPSKLGR
jgi:cyclophilin family peptidyl-prolyl cis-trans isomerase